MSEESKNIWKKPWKGPRGMAAWCIILFLASFVVIFVFELLSSFSRRPLTSAFVLSIIFSVTIALLFSIARWIFRPRNFRRTLFILASLATLVALFYAEENWRGKHAWQKFKQELEAKGETIDLNKLAPPPVPDDQNFAMAPIFVESISAQLTNASSRLKNWYGNQKEMLGHATLTNRLKMPVELNGRGLSFTNGRVDGDWRKAKETDLKAWQEYYRHLASITNFFPVADRAQTPAESVLVALSKYDSSIEDLRAASQRPFSRFPLGYRDENPAGILLPHLGLIKSPLAVLQLRAIAELQSSQTEKALDDIKLMFRLVDSIRAEPLFISQLVRIAMFQVTIEPIWEGLAEHKWNENQLAEIDSELSKLDFLADYQLAIRGERAFGAGYIDYINTHRNDFIDMERQEAANSGDKVEKILGSIFSKLIPSGWFEQNKVALGRMQTDYLLPMVNEQLKTISYSAHRAATRMTPYNWLTRMLMPGLDKAVKKFAYVQVCCDLARIACALERYRLAHGNYPETLDALAPQFLKTIPHDVMSGQSLKYYRGDDGEFILYSVGWNQKDDGGIVVFSKGKYPSVDIQKGDWVWKYPAK